MADSKSERKGQSPLNCQLCEIGVKISCKCAECDLLMCNRCKEKVHSKFKNATNHRIIDIKDVGKENTEKNRDFANINCKQHAGQTCCLFCETCDSVVCPSCIAKDHKKHDLVEISEAYDRKIQMMKRRQKQLQKEQDQMNQQKIRLKQLKTAKTSKYNKVDQDVLDQGKKFELYMEKIRKELQEHQNDVLQSINSDLDTIEKKNQQCEGHTSKTEEIIKTTDVTKFFEEVGEIEKLSAKSFVSQIQSTYHLVPVFIPGEITQSNVGMLQSDNKLKNVKLTVVKEFQTELQRVHYVSPCPDDSVWICNQTSEMLQKVKPQGNNLEILSSYKVKNVYGMALTPNNDLLLATGETCLKEIKNSTGAMEDSIYNTKPFQLTCVHVGKDYKVMVGGGSAERCVVIIMDQTGEQMTMYEEDKLKQPLLTYPRSITSTSNARIFILDYRYSDKHGRLVMLNQRGDEQYYTGHPDVNKDMPFNPVKLITTPDDNVIVVDIGSKTLHIFNNSGLLKTIFNTQHTILNPCSLGFSLSGQLYVGCYTAKGSRDNAKLYLVNISGF